MKLFATAAALLAALGLAACAVPAAGTSTASASTRHSYEEPDTGSMFGGGDSNRENPNLDSGLTGQPTGVAAPGSRR